MYGFCESVSSKARDINCCLSIWVGIGNIHMKAVVVVIFVTSYKSIRIDSAIYQSIVYGQLTR